MSITPKLVTGPVGELVPEHAIVCRVVKTSTMFLPRGVESTVEMVQESPAVEVDAALATSERPVHTFKDDGTLSVRLFRNPDARVVLNRNKPAGLCEMDGDDGRYRFIVEEFGAKK